jgi:hypothetical protein
MVNNTVGFIDLKSNHVFSVCGVDIIDHQYIIYHQHIR